MKNCRYTRCSKEASTVEASKVSLYDANGSMKFSCCQNAIYLVTELLTPNSKVVFPQSSISATNSLTTPFSVFQPLIVPSSKLPLIKRFSSQLQDGGTGGSISTFIGLKACLDPQSSDTVSRIRQDVFSVTSGAVNEVFSVFEFEKLPPQLDVHV